MLRLVDTVRIVFRAEAKVWIEMRFPGGNVKTDRAAYGAGIKLRSRGALLYGSATNEIDVTAATGQGRSDRSSLAVVAGKTMRQHVRPLRCACSCLGSPPGCCPSRLRAP